MKEVEHQLKNLSILKDPIRLFQAFNVSRQIAIIIGSIILTKSAMSTLDIGKFETLNYLGQFISVFWVNGMTQAFLAIYPKVAEVEKKAFISSTFTFFLGISFICSVILVVGRPLLLPFLIESKTIEGFYWFSLYSFINIPSMLIPSILMLKKQSSELLKFTIFYFLGYIILFFLNLIFGGKLINLLILLNAFAFALLLMSGRLSISFNLNAYKLQWVKRLTLIGSPLIGYAILSGIAPIYDSWLVQRFYEDKSIFAIFRYGAREFPLTVTLAIGLGTALVPLVSQNLSQGVKEIRLRSKRLYPYIFGTSALLLLGSKYFFPLVFNESFAASAPVFNIYILLIISRMIYPQTIMLGQKRTKALLYIAILELMINIFVSLALAFKFGLLGIAAGTVIAFSSEKIMQIIYLKLKRGISIHHYVDVKPYALYSAGLVIVWLFTILF